MFAWPCAAPACDAIGGVWEVADWAVFMRRTDQPCENNTIWARKPTKKVAAMEASTSASRRFFRRSGCRGRAAEALGWLINAPRSVGHDARGRHVQLRRILE